MLEIHHILGRVSDSAFNSSVLCNKCHSQIGHTTEEHQRIFNKSVVVLNDVGFKPEEKDMKFLTHYWSELVNQNTHDWLVRKFSTVDTSQKVP